MKTCSVTDCDRKHYARGYCIKHYTQWQRNGTPVERTRSTPNDFIVEGAITKIGCYDNNSQFVGYALIDTEDLDKCKPFKWRICNGRAVSDTSKRVFLHHFIYGLKRMVDHINRNPLDNRKSNLRPCSSAENNQNRSPNKNSLYKGVHWSKGSEKWIAKIKSAGKLYLLGAFDDPRLAALAYNKKAAELFGEFAYLNKIPLIRRTK